MNKTCGIFQFVRFVYYEKNKNKIPVFYYIMVILFPLSVPLLWFKKKYNLIFSTLVDRQ